MPHLTCPLFLHLACPLLHLEYPLWSTSGVFSLSVWAASRLLSVSSSMGIYRASVLSPQILRALEISESSLGSSLNLRTASLSGLGLAWALLGFVQGNPGLGNPRLAGAGFRRRDFLTMHASVSCPIS